MIPDYEKIIDINLATPLTAIPDGPDCHVCGDPTVKAIVEHRFALFEAKSLFVTKNAPGYECAADGTIYLSKAAVMELLLKAREHLVSRGSDKFLGIIDKKILFEQDILVDS